MADHIFEEFAQLFRGCATAFGTEEGGCYRLPAPRSIPLSEYIEGHLNGTHEPIGVYPMVGMYEGWTPEVGTMAMGTESEPTTWWVHWGCVDFDLGEVASLNHARNVQAVLRELGVSAWVERSRSKGYHLWVFASSWVPARVMRQALLGAAQVVDAPTTEVNPKQVTLKAEQLGNYVRLPYPGAYGRPASASDERRVVLDDADNVYPVGQFTAMAMRSRIGLEQLRAIGDELYVEPRRPQRPARAFPPSDMLGDPQMRLQGLAYTIWRDGPLDGAKRGHTLYKLACQIYEDGQHTAEEAEELLLDADERWGKFSARGEPEYITKMVDKVFADEEAF